MGFSRSSHGRGLRCAAPTALLYHGKILCHFPFRLLSLFMGRVEMNVPLLELLFFPS